MRILLAVDGSPHSSRAEALLRRAAGGAPHKVTVLHVTPPVVPSPDGGQSITEALKASGGALAEAAAAKLRKERRFSVGSAVVESADPAGAVLDRAEKAGSDLIVLGARGLTPFKSFLLGSVSQKVSRHFSGSVLIARSSSGKGLFRVLLAVDGSYPARRALDFLPSLGLPSDTRLTLAHVVAEPLEPWVAGDAGFTGGNYGAMVMLQKRARAALRKKGKRILEEAAARARKTFRRVERVMVEGHPAGQLLRLAESRGADLVVLGRRGLSKLERFLMGSVSQKVSVYAPCSTLIVK